MAITVSQAFRVSINPSAGTLTALTLTSANGGTLLPFAFGQAFKQGDIPSGKTVVADLANCQWTTKATWPDGSVKHGVIAGRATLTANTPLAVHLSAGTASSGTNIAESDLIALSPQASVQCGAFGTVTLSSLLGSPVKTFISGPQMSEFHYLGQVGTDAHLRVYFHVRLWAGGAMEITTVVENGFLLVAGPTLKGYVPQVIINGTSRYTNSGATLNQEHHCRWALIHWYGTDPQITPKHDTAYLMATKLVPNYGWLAPSAAKLNGYAGRTFVPMDPDNTDLPVTGMGSAGYSQWIGLLPEWDVLYLTSGGDARLYQAVLVNAFRGGRYSTHFRDSVTGRPFKFADHPNVWLSSGDPNSVPTPTGGQTYIWQDENSQAHQPSIGFFAYLLSGRYFCLEEMQFWLTANMANSNYVYRFGVKCIWGGQVREVAWDLRTQAQVCALTPDEDSALRTDWATSLGWNFSYKVSQFITGTVSSGTFVNNLGCVGLYSANGLTTDAYSPGNGIWDDALWEQHFVTQAIGYAWDLEPNLSSADRISHQQIRDFAYQNAVGVLGDLNTGWPWRSAAQYQIGWGTPEHLPPTWYADWKSAYTANTAEYGYAALDGANTLLGAGGADPASMATGYWGNLHPAIAFAVDHGAVGAATSFARMSGASNYTTSSNGFNNTPIWGIKPRS